MGAPYPIDEAVGGNSKASIRTPRSAHGCRRERCASRPRCRNGAGRVRNRKKTPRWGRGRWASAFSNRRRPPMSRSSCSICAWNSRAVPALAIADAMPRAWRAAAKPGTPRGGRRSSTASAAFCGPPLWRQAPAPPFQPRVRGPAEAGPAYATSMAGSAGRISNSSGSGVTAANAITSVPATAAECRSPFGRTCARAARSQVPPPDRNRR